MWVFLKKAKHGVPNCGNKCRIDPFMLLLYLAYMRIFHFSAAIYAKTEAFSQWRIYHGANSTSIPCPSAKLKFRGAPFLLTVFLNDFYYFLTKKILLSEYKLSAFSRPNRQTEIRVHLSRNVLKKA